MGRGGDRDTKAKRGRRGSGARSAPARRGARSHGRGRRRTLARRLALPLRGCRGPRGRPPHTSERGVPADRFPAPHFFGPTAPRRHSQSRPGRSPPPRGGSRCARLGGHPEGVRAPQKLPGSRRRPPGSGGLEGARGSPGCGGDGGPLSLDGAAEPWQPLPPPLPPPTQLTCHPQPRHRDSRRKSHSGSPLIGPVRAASPSLREGSAERDWTPALSVRPRAAPPLPSRHGAARAAGPPGARLRPRGVRGVRGGGGARGWMGGVRRGRVPA
ncbi:unnamed protein product [Pipistrellus nathusii]|uniref:Uncharacterized protein n=1 Tax=Pipistrellus nathusii TaxID=59473 RepID=A0ABN9ZVL4_PIPNA